MKDFRVSESVKAIKFGEVSGDLEWKKYFQRQ